MIGLKSTIVQIFSQLENEGKLHLARRKLNALLDFLICLPDLYSKAVTEDNIKKGWFESGLLDEETCTTPDIIKMLGTCRGHHTLQDEERYFKYFHQGFIRSLEHGQLTETDLSEFGFDHGEFISSST